jgi:hypothetical protein
VRTHPFLLTLGVTGIVAIFVASSLLDVPFWVTAIALAGWAVLLNVVVRVRR